MAQRNDMIETTRALFEPKTREQWAAIYKDDCLRWQAESAQNKFAWKQMTMAQKMRVAEIWREGQGLYTFESCVRGRPQYVFPPHVSKFDEKRRRVL